MPRTNKVQSSGKKTPPKHAGKQKARPDRHRAMVFDSADFQMKPFASVEAARSRIEKEIQGLVDSQEGEMLDSLIYVADGRLLMAQVRVVITPVTDRKTINRARRFLEEEQENAEYLDAEAARNKTRQRKKSAMFEEFERPTCPAQA